MVGGWHEPSPSRPARQSDPGLRHCNGAVRDRDRRLVVLPASLADGGCQSRGTKQWELRWRKTLLPGSVPSLD